MPLRFDSEESAVAFDSHWLAHPLPVVASAARRRIAGQVRARRAAAFDDFPTTIRHILRKQLVQSDLSMEQVAARLSMHRRTLDRRLKQHGLDYREVLESVKLDVACQLLRDTRLPLPEIAASLHYSSAANFATAFRRWTGATPSAYRRGAD